MENIKIPTKITIMEKSTEINLNKKEKKSKPNEGKYLNIYLKIKPENNMREDIILLKRIIGVNNTELFTGLLKIALHSLDSYLAPYREGSINELQKYFK